MILTLAGQKGGTGKSTLAVHLAAEWQARGARVLLADLDPQGTALTWAEVAAEAGHAAPDVIAIGDNVRAALPGLAAGYDVTILDTAGRQGRRLAGALALADVALVPCQPSPADVWALTGTVELIDQVRELRPDLIAAIVINGRQRTALGAAARDALAAVGLPVARSELGRRVAFAEALAAGLGVTHYDRGDAALELGRLADEIEALAGLDLAGLTARGAAHGA